MRRSVPIAATLAAAAAACSLARGVGAGQGAAGAVPPSEHPRLQRPIDLDEPCIGLDEALRRVGRQTGVTLRVSPELAPENVLLIIRSRPAGEVLERLADVLEYRWRKRGD